MSAFSVIINPIVGQYNTYNMFSCVKCIHLIISYDIFQHFSLSEGSQKVMIGIIASENVNNYERPLRDKLMNELTFYTYQRLRFLPLVDSLPTSKDQF